MWEYKEEPYKTTNNQADLIIFLNKQGLEGWELITIEKPYRNTSFVEYYNLYFKRKIVQKL